MIHSNVYRDNLPPRSTNIFGARTEDEIIFPGYFARLALRRSTRFRSQGQVSRASRGA